MLAENVSRQSGRASEEVSWERSEREMTVVGLRDRWWICSEAEFSQLLMCARDV